MDVNESNHFVVYVCHYAVSFKLTQQVIMLYVHDISIKMAKKKKLPGLGDGLDTGRESEGLS